MMHMGNAAITQGLDIGKARLREYIINSEGTRQAVGVPANRNSTSADIGLDTLDSRGKKTNTSAEDDDF
jgi:hypothetical protein